MCGRPARASERFVTTEGCSGLDEWIQIYARECSIEEQQVLSSVAEKAGRYTKLFGVGTDRVTMTVYEKQFEKQFVNEDLVKSYAKGRPTYPAELFQLLASLTTHHELAWDVGTGNGQAAFSVAAHYTSVVATDVSEPQLSLAKKRENITYAKMSATPDSPEELERIVGPEGSVDLVTAAAALAWFDHDKFYPIVKRMLRKPGGVLAAWSYPWKLWKISPEFEAALNRWNETVTPYKTGVRYSLEDLPFPFDPVPGVEAGKGIEGSPLEIWMETRSSFDDLMVLLRSFSPVQRALDQGVDLLNEDARQALSKAWGPEKVRTISMALCVLLGTVNADASLIEVTFST